MLVPTYFNTANDFETLFDEFDHILKGSKRTAFSSVACDTFETPDHFFIFMDIPGVKHEDLKISMEEKTLTVQGQKSFSFKSDSVERVHQRERFFGDFKRSFSLPYMIAEEDIKTFYKNGVLQIALPKKEAPQAKTIEVQTDDEPGFFQKFLESPDEKA